MKLILPALLLLLCGAQPALALDTVLERSHTQAEFVVIHMAIDRVHGLIPLQSGTATLGSNNLPTALNATFDVAGVNTQNANRDKDLRENYFEVAQFPTITFVERSVKGTPDAFTLTGDLTIHGVTKTVDLACKVGGVATINGKKHVAFTGTATVDRRDFGMTLIKLLDNQLFAGFQVTISLEADAAEQ